MRTIAVVNQKGGVGKTTTTLNLGHALALSGRRVALIDLDPQGHLGASLGCHEPEAGMDEVLLEGRPLGEVLLPVRPGLWLAPAGQRLGDLEHLQHGGVDRGRRLAVAVKDLPLAPDLLLVDCPPAAGLLVANALFASAEVLVPVAGEFLALNGVSQLVRVLRSLESMAGVALRRMFLLTRFQPRGRLAREVRERLLAYFPGQLLATPVRENSALAESPAFGQTIFEYRPRSHGAVDYRSLAEELMHGRMT